MNRTPSLRLIVEIVGAAKVFRGGGSEVFGVALDAKLKSAAASLPANVFE